MPFCTACGSSVDADANYCTACGEPTVHASPDDDTDGDGADSATAEERRSEVSPLEARGRRLAAAGIGTTTLGAFLPWFEYRATGAARTVEGIDHDGKATLLMVGIAGLVLLLGRGRRWSIPARAVVCILGMAVALTAWSYIAGPWEPAASDLIWDQVGIGIGLYVTGLGGALLALGPLYPLRSRLE